MADMAQKALAVCAEYDRWMCEIADLSAKIGVAPDTCTRAAHGEFGLYFPEGAETHLDEVFRGYVEDRQFEPVLHHWSPQEAVAMVSECPHCSAVYAAIHARKLARQQLGIVKRKIRAIGRAADSRAPA
ncbi:hypothetical protein LMG19089_02889 [Ralstonia edaphis]|uniref:hypothetical protein n=1 Tax=Ralstonia edaphi TaxID=3058599 RepID=UPI0028F66803|nr:hypothetical protein [Ralstonia sp. LMG 6871]CAJ0701641.1 hypothetical protein LMG19089_02889 [Ralstonia sp. LMG 6871]